MSLRRTSCGLIQHTAFEGDALAAWLVAANRDHDLNTGNLLPDEDCSFEGGTVGNWGTLTNCAIANDAAHGYHCSHSIKMTVTADGWAGTRLTLTGLVAAGSENTFAVKFKGVVGRGYYVRLWDNVAGATDSANVIADGTWQTVNVTHTFGAGSVTRYVYMRAQADALAGDIVYWDAGILKAGASATPPTSLVYVDAVQVGGDVCTITADCYRDAGIVATADPYTSHITTGIIARTKVKMTAQPAGDHAQGLGAADLAAAPVCGISDFDYDEPVSEVFDVAADRRADYRAALIYNAAVGALDTYDIHEIRFDATDAHVRCLDQATMTLHAGCSGSHAHAYTNDLWFYAGIRRTDAYYGTMVLDYFQLYLSNFITLSGLPIGAVVKLYSTTWTALATATADANGNATLDVSGVEFPHAGAIRIFSPTGSYLAQYPADGTTSSSIWGGDDYDYTDTTGLAYVDEAFFRNCGDGGEIILNLNDHEAYTLLNDGFRCPPPQPRQDYIDPPAVDGRTLSDAMKYENRVLNFRLLLEGADASSIDNAVTDAMVEINKRESVIAYRPRNREDTVFFKCWRGYNVLPNIYPLAEFLNQDKSFIEWECEADPFAIGCKTLLPIFDQLCPNGDMEDWSVVAPDNAPDDWTETCAGGSTIDVSVITFWHGLSSAEFTNVGGAGNCYMTTDDYIAVDVDDYYHFDCFAYGYAATPELELQVLCYDDLLALVGTVVVVKANVTNGGWFQHAHKNDALMGVLSPFGTGTANDFPVGTTSVKLRVHNNTDGQACFVDQIYFGKSKYAPQHRVEVPCTVNVPPEDVKGDVPALADVYFDEVYWDLYALFLGQRDEYHAAFDGVCEPTDGTSTPDANVCLTQDYERYDVPSNMIDTVADRHSFEDPVLGDGVNCAYTAWDEVFNGVNSFMKNRTDNPYYGLQNPEWTCSGVVGTYYDDYLTTPAAADVPAYITINPLLDYYCYFYEMGGATGGWGSVQLRLVVRCFDVGSNYLGVVNVWKDTPTSSTAWTKQGRLIEASEWPAGTDKIRVRVRVAGTPSAHPTGMPRLRADFVYFGLGTGTTVGTCDFALESHKGSYLPISSISVSAATPGDSTLTLQGQIVSAASGAITNVFAQSDAEFGDPNTQWVCVAILDDKWDTLAVPTSHVADSADLADLRQRLTLLLGPFFDDTRDFWTDYIAIIPLDRAILRSAGLAGEDHLILDCGSEFESVLKSLDGTLETATLMDTSKSVATLNFAADPTGINMVLLALYDNDDSFEPRNILDMKLIYRPLYYIVETE